MKEKVLTSSQHIVFFFFGSLSCTTILFILEFYCAATFSSLLFLDTNN